MTMTPTLALVPGLVNYGDAIEAEISALASVIAAAPDLNDRYEARWLAIQLLEGEDQFLQQASPTTAASLRAALEQSRNRLQALYGEDFDIALTDRRYSFVHDVVSDVVSMRGVAHVTRSDRIDRILTHKWLGIPILLALMYVVFNLVQTVSAPYLDWIDAAIAGPIAGWFTALLSALHAPAWITSLVVDGVLAGVGGVLVFLPGLLVMYFSLAFLEGSGYMARAAFVMDRAMNVVGLQGQSFVPMILGFGCNVPAVYATRTIENQSARRLTALLIPFMSCSARLPVYVIFGLAFFPHRANVVIWGLYVMGIVVAAIVGIVLSRTVFRGASPGTFMMEMPPYRWPSMRELLRYTSRQSAAFVRRAGTFILAMSIVFWLLLNLPWGVASAHDSYFGKLSERVAPALEPAGFGKWELGGALVTGLVAKEAVVSSLSQIYVGEAGTDEAGGVGLFEGVAEIGEGFIVATLGAGRQLLEVFTPGITLFPDNIAPETTALTKALQQALTPLAALAFLAFVLLYVPCLATVGAQLQEFGWRWSAVSVGIMVIVPWLVAVLIYQGGQALGFG